MQGTYWEDGGLEMSAIKDETSNASCGQKSEQMA